MRFFLFIAATAFEVAPGETNLVQLKAGGSSILKLEYESTDTATYTFAASLDTGTTFDTSSATKDSTLKTIQYTLLPSFVTDGYGTYLLNLTLGDGSAGIDVYKEVVLFYEEAIAGFQVMTIPLISKRAWDFIVYCKWDVILICLKIIVCLTKIICIHFETQDNFHISLEIL